MDQRYFLDELLYSKKARSDFRGPKFFWYINLHSLYIVEIMPSLENYSLILSEAPSITRNFFDSIHQSDLSIILHFRQQFRHQPLITFLYVKSSRYEKTCNLCRYENLCTNAVLILLLAASVWQIRSS